MMDTAYLYLSGVSSIGFVYFLQTNILAAKEGTIRSVLFQEKDNIPAFSTVIEFQEDS